jgi:Mn-dependent DtxR family transcriptional regulator
MDEKAAETEAHKLEHAVSDPAFQALRDALRVVAPQGVDSRFYNH